MKPADPCGPLAETLLGPALFTPSECAGQAGVDPETARRLWRALGFPPVDEGDALFTRADVEILAAVRALVELRGVDASDLVQLTRVIGQSLARVAEAQVTTVAERLDAADTLPEEAAVGGLADRVRSLAPGLEQFLGYVWRRHLLAVVRRRAGVVAGDGTLALTIGFADLVGFTAVSRDLEPRELAAMIDRFEAVAYEHIPERGGRVVKMIGDEVMFAVDDGAFAADIAVALVEAHARAPDLPDVRVGLAHGPTLSWEGDLFGPTVNLASRLMHAARPGTVLVADEIGTRLRDDPRFEMRHLRAVKLPGIGRVRPWVLRRARPLGP